MNGQSAPVGGGNGGSASGANGGSINVLNENDGDGMRVTSVGGSGADGLSNSGDHYVVGGSGGHGGNGGDVVATNVAYPDPTHIVPAKGIYTHNGQGDGIIAMSVGGGGGEGGGAIANGTFSAISIGGSGGDGGNGGTVNVINDLPVVTYNLQSIGIKAMSIGGGGGQGGTASASSSSWLGGAFAMATGGSGGKGGNGGAVSVTQNTNGSVTTGGLDPTSPIYFATAQDYYVANGAAPGDFSTGILAQSIGGGGGNGGQSVTTAGVSLLGVAITVGHGGSGGDGGIGSSVQVTNNGNVTTGGRMAPGILAQSIGGGGGNGGVQFSNINQASLVSLGVTVGFGGSGGAGGASNDVNVTNSGAIDTYGANSGAIVAQSIGGGGGNGGAIIDATTGDAPLALAVGVTMGGSGGQGLNAGSATTTLQTGSSISTYGDNSNALLVQSIGGGGGAGGSIQTYSQMTGNGKNFDSTDSSQLPTTLPPNADFNFPEVPSPKSLAVSIGVNLGGKAAGGGIAGNASATVTGAVNTYGALSAGALVQSIGGGGGAGGHVMAYDATEVSDSPLPTNSLKDSAVHVGVGIGGQGGQGGNAGTAELTLSAGAINTSGPGSVGAIVQSIGGGGGAGGSVHTYSAVSAIPTDPADLAARYAAKIPGSGFSASGNLNAEVNVGGKGNAAGNGAAVVINLDGGTISTVGHQSDGLVAQSIGGGGGMGGSIFADGFVGVGAYNLTANVSGAGGGGGSGGSVLVTGAPGAQQQTVISTTGDISYGVLAQSIGGGGGAGGAGHVDFQKAGRMLANSSFTATVGGAGGTGNAGGDVHVDSVTVTTGGAGANGILAQSIGGGGGIGGSSLASGATNITLGGNGGSGNDGGAIAIHNVTVTTSGGAAAGILAQSIGGGGGHVGQGGLNDLISEADIVRNSSFTLTTSGAAGDGHDVNIGCSPDAANQVADCAINVTTHGATGIGVLAQSIGGGGGSTQVSNAGYDSFDITLNAGAAGAGASGRVGILDSATIGKLNVVTNGDGAIGIVTQSLDSGGGAFLFDDAAASKIAYQLGSGVSGANGGTLIDFFGSVATNGNHAAGIYAQSLSNAYTVFDTTGPTVVYGGNAINTATNWIHLHEGSSITASGAYSDALWVKTASSAAADIQPFPGFDPGSSQPPAYDTTPRAVAVIANGAIKVTGEGAWAIRIDNNAGDAAIEDGQVTSYLQVGMGPLSPQGIMIPQISSGPNAAGAIYVKDTGSTRVDIVGPVAAQNGPAIRIDAGKIALNIDGYFGAIQGDIDATLTQPNSSMVLVLGQSVTGSVNAISNGGYVKIDNDNGNILNPNGTAISFDTTNARISLGQALTGDVVGPALTTDNVANPATVIAGNSTGSVIGAIRLVTLPNPEGSGLNFRIDGSGGHSDIWNIASVDFSQATAYNGLELTKLPTAAFKPFTLIQVANGAPANGSPSTFGLRPDLALATRYDLSYASGPNQSATVTLNGVSVDFTRASLPSSYGSAVQLANAQVQAVYNAITPVDPTKPIYMDLLAAANDFHRGNLESDLNNMNYVYHQSEQESAATLASNSNDDLLSCGGDVLASVNPVAQGRCNWAKATYSDAERDNGSHRDTATGLAMGHQLELSDNFFLGYGAHYTNTTFNSDVTHADGKRAGVGAVLKYTDGRNFGSLSILASYGWADSLRQVVTRTGALTASSHHRNLVIAPRLRLGHLFDIEPLDLVTMVDFDLPIVRDYGYVEHGPSAYNMRIAPNTNTLFDIHPSVQLGGHFRLGGVNVRGFGSLGYRFAFNNIEAKTSLVDGIDPNFQALAVYHRDRRQVTYGLGTIIDMSDRLELRLNYDLAKGSEDRSERFSMKAALKF